MKDQTRQAFEQFLHDPLCTEAQYQLGATEKNIDLLQNLLWLAFVAGAKYAQARSKAEHA